MVVNATTTNSKFQSNQRYNLSFDNSEKMQKFMEKRSQTYPPVRNMLAEQEQKPLNQTYTIGSSLRQSSSFRQQRSGSIDSDFGEYSNAIAGIFPRSFAGGTPCRKPTQSQAINRMLSTQLPLIDGCSAERLCCQRPWSKTQIELADFKKTLKQIN